MFSFITRKPLWVNILVAIGLVVILFLIFMFSLNWITRHGESTTVPSLTGKKLDAVQQLMDEEGFELIIQDSVFYDSLPRGVVVQQFPEPGQVVKSNRTIFVKINRYVTPDVSLPDLVGSTLRAAEMTLSGLGLRKGDTSTKAAFAPGTVLEMLIDGKPIRPGDKVKLGTRVDLVISRGLDNQTGTYLPDMIGWTVAEAQAWFVQNNLDLQLIIIPADPADPSAVYIRQQDPEAVRSDGAKAIIRSGQIVTIWHQSEPVQKRIDSTSTTPPPGNNDY